jgi:hypothetical protein
MNLIGKAVVALFAAASALNPAWAGGAEMRDGTPGHPSVDCMDWLISGRNALGCMNSLRYWGGRYAAQVGDHVAGAEMTEAQRAAYLDRIETACRTLEGLDGRLRLEQVAKATNACVNEVLAVAQETAYPHAGPLTQMANTLLDISLKLIIMPNPRDLTVRPQP